MATANLNDTDIETEDVPAFTDDAALHLWRACEFTLSLLAEADSCAFALIRSEINAAIRKATVDTKVNNHFLKKDGLFMLSNVSRHSRELRSVSRRLILRNLAGAIELVDAGGKPVSDGAAAFTWSLAFADSQQA